MSEWKRKRSWEGKTILFEGAFNWHGEVSKEYGYYANKYWAFFYFTRRLAKKYDCSTTRVRYYFKGTNKYTLKEVRKKNGKDNNQDAGGPAQAGDFPERKS